MKVRDDMLITRLQNAINGHYGCHSDNPFPLEGAAKLLSDRELLKIPNIGKSSVALLRGMYPPAPLPFVCWSQTYYGPISVRLAYNG